MKNYVQPSRRGAIFLDRDGTLNPDPGYISSPDQLELFPGVGEALSKLQLKGFYLVVVTNQSGIARGYLTEKVLEKVHDRLNQLLAPFGVEIDLVKHCPHHPKDSCLCRKPSPALVFEAVDDLGVDLKKSYFIGDRISDLLAGKNAGLAGSILVKTGEKPIAETLDLADFVAEDLTAAADWILSKER